MPLLAVLSFAMTTLSLPKAPTPDVAPPQVSIRNTTDPTAIDPLARQFYWVSVDAFLKHGPLPQPTSFECGTELIEWLAEHAEIWTIPQNLEITNLDKRAFDMSVVTSQRVTTPAADSDQGFYVLCGKEEAPDWDREAYLELSADDGRGHERLQIDTTSGDPASLFKREPPYQKFGSELYINGEHALNLKIDNSTTEHERVSLALRLTDDAGTTQDVPIPILTSKGTLANIFEMHPVGADKGIIVHAMLSEPGATDWRLACFIDEDTQQTDYCDPWEIAGLEARRWQNPGILQRYFNLAIPESCETPDALSDMLTDAWLSYYQTAQGNPNEYEWLDIVIDPLLQIREVCGSDVFDIVSHNGDRNMQQALDMLTPERWLDAKPDWADCGSTPVDAAMRWNSGSISICEDATVVVRPEDEPSWIASDLGGATGTSYAYTDTRSVGFDKYFDWVIVSDNGIDTPPPDLFTVAERWSTSRPLVMHTSWSRNLFIAVPSTDHHMPSLPTQPAPIYAE